MTLFKDITKFISYNFPCFIKRNIKEFPIHIIVQQQKGFPTHIFKTYFYDKYDNYIFSLMCFLKLKCFEKYLILFKVLSDSVLRIITFKRRILEAKIVLSEYQTLQLVDISSCGMMLKPF